MRRLLWLEDFNEPAPPPPEVETVDGDDDDLPEPTPEPPPNPYAEAWTQGFIAGCRQQECNARDAGHAFTAVMAERLAEIEEKLQAIANQSAAIMGGLLIDMLTEALPQDWPDGIADRVQAVSNAIRPVFTLDPKLQIHIEPMGEIAFRDLPGFYKALETSQPADLPLGLRWPPSTDPKDIVDDLKAAIAGTN